MAWLAWRWLLRDLRAGQLWVLAAAVAVAVAAAGAVGLLVQRVGAALERQADTLLGADLALTADRPLPETLVTEAERRGLRAVRTLRLPTMALGPEGSRGLRSRLVGLLAVEPGYPLRGELRIAPSPYGPDRPASGVPEAGEAWVEPAVLRALGLAVGGELRLGAAAFRVGAVLRRSPDRGVQALAVAPRVLVRLEAVAATGLLVPGARVRHGLLVAGPPEAVDGYRRWLEGRLPPGARAVSAAESRPELRAALDRARAFLGLAALVTALMAGAGAAVAVRRHVAGRLDACAVLRAFGVGRRRLVALHLGELAWLALLAGGTGAALGWGVQEVLARALEGLAGRPLPPAGPGPLLATLGAGLGVGVGAVVAFALPPLLALGRVPTLRVLRRELPPPAAPLWAVALLGPLWVGLLGWLQAGDGELAALVLAGAALLLAALALAGRLAAALAARLLGRLPGAGPLLVAGALRRRGAVQGQLAAVGLAALVLLLLGVVRSDLLEAWRAALPPDAPNRFLIGILPDQAGPLAAFFREAGLEPPRLHPTVRARLEAVDGRPVQAEAYADPRARRLALRVYHLSWAERPGPDERVVAGRWWGPGEEGVRFSVEEGWARALGVGLGSRLRFRVGDRVLEGRVTSLRRVDWGSLRANFFVLASPGALEGFPLSHIAALHLPEGRGEVLERLVRRFPNVSVIDVSALVAQVRAILDRVAGILEALFLLTAAASLVVLVAALQATVAERRREAALLRALGAPRRLLHRVLAAELLGLGALAGLLGAVGAALVGRQVAERVFGLAYVPDPALWLAGAGGGALLVAAAGLATLGRIPGRPPWRVLLGGLED